jgi:tetratricopeptide (TPR) repeat protein
LTPESLKKLAKLAEQLDHFKVAERLYRQYAALPKVRDGAITIAGFLGRSGRVKEGLDLLEPLWSQNHDPEAVGVACLQVLMYSKKRAEDAQFNRVAGWLERAIDQKRNATSLLFSLGVVREEARRFDEAQSLYREVIERVDRIQPARPDEIELLASAYNNLAVLTALKDGDGKAALANANRAIELVGPRPVLLDSRGVIHLCLKQTREAINDLENSVKISRTPVVLFHLAQAYFQANEKVKSKQFLSEAKAMGLNQNRIGAGTLQWLELPAYQKLTIELGITASADTIRGGDTIRGSEGSVDTIRFVVFAPLCADT